MDSFVKSILNSWSLGQFVERFETAGIDAEIFDCIDDNLINSLFEKHECGFRKKFINKFEVWKQSPDPFATTPNSPILTKEASTTLTSSTLCACSEENVFLTDVPVLSIAPNQRKSVAELLSSTTRGKIVLAKFKMSNVVNMSLLSDVIIEYEFEYNNCYRIKGKRLQELANEISLIFKSEDSSVEDYSKLLYYPSKSATKSSRGFNAGGVLQDKYLNYRRKLIAVKLIKDHEEDTPEQVTHEQIVWLTSNTEPEIEIIEKWKNTFPSRQRFNNIVQFFKYYKCLRTPFGYKLLCLDYELLYPASVNTFLIEWNSVSQQIVQYAKDKKKLLPSDELLITAGKENIVALLCLPRILGCIVRKRKATDCFGTTITEVLQSFILNVSALENLDDFYTTRKNTDEKEIGPHVVVIGNFENVNAVYVKIHENLFDVSSQDIIEAIDICYKCIVALNSNFTVECRHIWNFIQRYFYKDENNIKPYAVVTSFIKDLQKYN